MNIFEMREKRTHVLARASAILDRADADSRDLTPAEQAEYDGAVSEAERINAQIRTEEQRTPDFGNGPVPLALVGNIPRGQPVSDPPTDPVGFQGNHIAPGSTPRMAAFKNDRTGREIAYRSGQWLRATLLQDAGAYQWCISNGMRPDVMSAIATSPNTAGGALVPDELGRTVIELVESYGTFRRNADNVPMSSDSLTIPRRTGGLTAHYVGENEEGTESDPTWDNVTFVAKKLMALTRMSSEISEDAIISMADKLTLEIALAFAQKEDSVGFLGDGTSTYGGHVGVLVKALDGSHDMAKVAAASGHDTFAEIDADDLIKLMAAIPAYAKTGAKWYCGPVAMELVFNAIQVGASGNSMDNLANQVQPRFLGYPIEVSPVFPDSASATYAGAAMLAFGNLQQSATLATRRDIRVQLSEHRYFEHDQIGVKGTMRHSINVHDLGSNTEKSPLAVLVGG